MTSHSAARHRTYCEIDLSALRTNFRLLKAAIGPQRDILLVVKSDAYGHGAGTVAAVAAEFGVYRFAVVSVDASDLRSTYHTSLDTTAQPQSGWYVSWDVP
mgnify:CR=1 FL=1